MLVVVTAALVALPSVVVAYRLSQELPDEVRSLLALEGYATLGMALLAIALAAWLAIRTTRPMTAIREAAQDLASGQLERRVVVEGTVEHRALAGAFNEMAARLEQMVKARYRSEAELRRARNEAVEAAQMKSRFLATMSHEIRTPMNGVIGMVALMRESKLTEEQREFTETIHSSAQQLLAVIDDILDFSKAEAGKLRLVSEPFDLWTTLETVVDLVAPGAEKRGLEVVCSVAPDLPRVVTGDMARLRQILANLVGNAVKFTEHGEIVVRAEPEHRTEHMVAVRVSVHDSGIGIALAAQKNLFQPFVQADDSTSRRFGGTGLGIAIAKQLVEAMHGRIRVDSTPGVGTVFTFTAELGCEEPRAPHRPRWQSKPRAVVIETNDAARTAVTEQLEALGFQVSGARAPLAVDTAPEVTLVDPRVLSEPTAAGLEELRTRMGLADDAPMVLMAPLRQRVGLEVLLTERVRFARKPIRHDTLELSVARAMGEPTNDVTTQDLMRLIAQPPPPVPTTKPQVAGTPSPLRVLVAEDNPVNQRVAKHMLAKLGVVPTVVNNGREAVDEVTRQTYDVVLVDVQMPEMDGYQATVEIRKLEPKIGHISIFAMTANAMQGDREFCLSVGMDDYIPKPITLPALRALLER